MLKFLIMNATLKNILAVVLGMIVGVFFLAGGIANIYMLGGPLYFTIIDLVLAYIPMAWLGCKLFR